MMRAILVRDYYSKQSDLDELNFELKNCKSILKEIQTSTGGGGTVLIIDVVTRKEKLEKINYISNEEGIINNSI